MPLSQIRSFSVDSCKRLLLIWSFSVDSCKRLLLIWSFFVDSWMLSLLIFSYFMNCINFMFCVNYLLLLLGERDRFYRRDAFGRFVPYKPVEHSIPALANTSYRRLLKHRYVQICFLWSFALIICIRGVYFPAYWEIKHMNSQ